MVEQQGVPLWLWSRDLSFTEFPFTASFACICHMATFDCSSATLDTGYLYITREVL